MLRAALPALALCALAPQASAGHAIDFWATPQRGANCFNERPPDAQYFRALRGYGATWVRLTFSKWKSARAGRDFLFGSLDDYRELVPEDLATLRKVLDAAHAAGLQVVVTPLELPGSRWRQQNGGKFDDRIWSDGKKYWEQSAAFWRDLATALKEHPAIAAYNLINEPAPELEGGLEEHAPPHVMRAWYGKRLGTSRDLMDFYKVLIDAVRSVDETTPVMLDAGFYAATDAFAYWIGLLDDPFQLFAYHMYEPWEMTSTPNMKREKPLRYPGPASSAGTGGHWDAARVRAYLQQPLDWAREHGVPVGRMVAAEFGCVRTWVDCPRYLEDVVATLEAQGVHWAFYSFREQWDGMDYELGAAQLPWQYWQAQEQGRDYPLKRGPNPVFDPILRRLRGAERKQSP